MKQVWFRGSCKRLVACSVLLNLFQSFFFVMSRLVLFGKLINQTKCFAHIWDSHVAQYAQVIQIKMAVITVVGVVCNYLVLTYFILETTFLTVFF